MPVQKCAKSTQFYDTFHACSEMCKIYSIMVHFMPVQKCAKSTQICDFMPLQKGGKSREYASFALAGCIKSKGSGCGLCVNHACDICKIKRASML